MIKKFLIICLILFSLEVRSLTEDLGWDTVEIDDPLIIEMINTKAFQRLRFIDQSGPTAYFGVAKPMSRYDHSIGVWYLTKKYGAKQKEQVAALLHDVSHTAFSHLAEVVFKHKNHEKSYQDVIHSEYLLNSDILPVSLKYGITLQELDPDNEEYSILERPLPDICSDRLQYNLYTALNLKILDKDEIKLILDHLHYENDMWFFDDIDIAKKFGNIPLILNEKHWASAENNVIYLYFSQAIIRAFELKLISEEDFHFGTDKEILSKLYSSNDNIILDLIAKCESINNNFKIISDESDYDINFKSKFRGIDPYVCMEGKCQRLTELDAEFNKKFNQVKQWCKEGYKVRLKNI